MSHLFYLAYGSNLHPDRLRQPDRVPSATVAGTVALPGYQLKFNKRGTDGSAKCNIEATSDGTLRVYAAVFEMETGDKPNLDRAEAGYTPLNLQIKLNGQAREVFTYIAAPENIDDTLQPYDWYKAMVLLGVRYHRFPEDYLRQMEAVVATLDQDKERRTRCKRILAGMMQTNFSR